jgi:hypothetical protein
MLLFTIHLSFLGPAPIIIANGCGTDGHDPGSPTNTLQFKIQFDHDVFCQR